MVPVFSGDADPVTALDSRATARAVIMALVPNDSAGRAAPVSVEQLGKFQLLNGVSASARRDLLHAADERELAGRTVLIHQGEPNGTMYLIVEGELAVHLDDVDGDPIAIIPAGETVGELSLLDGSVASAHVVAHTTPCRVLALDEAAFWNLTNDSHAFAVQLLVKLAERLRANNTAVSKNVERRRMFERAAMFDGLTGIHNRRWLDDTLHRLVRRHEQGGSSLCVSLIDIDHFKRFNDTYGHDAGDHVLTRVAAVMSQNLRPTDLVARFGGEEFVILFPDTELDQAETAANRVRLAVAADQQVMDDGRELPNVTISMGVCQLAAGMDVPTLLKTADTAMYRAKKAGRNRVMVGTVADLQQP